MVAHNRLKLSVGDKQGRLTLTACNGPNKWGLVEWQASCECGASTTVKGPDFVAGRKRSCGCFRRETTKLTKTTHGASKTYEYAAWCAMRNRCYQTTNPSYPEWGGRGIGVCDRWRNSFANFLADMGKRPSSRHSLGRVDNDALYSPENCRWETPLVQGQNKRNNIRIELEGEVLTVSEASRRAGVNAGSVYSYVWKGKGSPQKAFDHFASKPVRDPQYLMGETQNAPL